MTDEKQRAAFESSIAVLLHNMARARNGQYLHPAPIAAWMAWQAATAQATGKLESAIKKIHRAKGRHHNQIAMCDLYDLVGLPCVRPATAGGTDPAEVAR